MKSFSTLALIGMTSLLIGCASSDKKDTANDLPVPANAPAATAPASEPLTTVAPVAPAAPSAVTQTTGIATTTTATADYTVVSGDSLWKIAREHKTSVGKLKALNNLTTDKLMSGQVIKVPAAQ